MAVYYESAARPGGAKKLVSVRSDSMIGAVLSAADHIVYDGTPVFVILVQGSAYQRDFLAKYGN